MPKTACHPALVAVGFVLIGSAHFSDRDNYELIARWAGGETHIAAKSRKVCENAIGAIRFGWLVGIPANADLRCLPHPNMFTPRSDCIAGFNCGKAD